MKKIKKLIALVLLTILAIPGVGTETAFASTQNGVTNLGIEWMSEAGTSQQIRLSWDSPSSVPDTADEALPSHNNLYLQGFGAQKYTVQYKNVTLNSTGNWTSQTTPAPPPPSALTKYAYTFQNFSAQSGGLFSFRVYPEHYHPVYTNGVLTATTTITPVEKDIKEALFLSDIKVEATGENGKLNITWDNPTYGGADVFPYYNIYYSRGENTDGTTPKRVATSECVDIISAGNVPRISYTIEDPGIHTGKYNIKIEPLNKSGKEIRTVGQVYFRPEGSAVEIPYNIALTANQYVTSATVSVNISLVEVSRDIVNLFWGDITPLGNVKEIAVFSAATEEEFESIFSRYINDAIKPTPIITLTSPYAQYYQLPLPLDKTAAYGIVVRVGTDTFFESNVVTFTPSDYKTIPNSPDIHEITGPVSTMVDLWWDAFVRESMEGDTISELKIGNVLYPYDNSISYDLYIVDDLDKLETFRSSGITLASLDNTTVNPAAAHPKTKGGPSVPAYTYSASSYLDIDEQGWPQRPQLVKNKLYYVMIIAKTSTGIESAPAYATFYISMDGYISSPPMLRKPPLEIRKDSSGSDVITQTTIDVTWHEEWSEVYDYSRDLTGGYDPDNNNPEWQTKAAIVGDLLKYGDDTEGYDESDFIDIDSLKKLLSADVPYRTLTLKDSLYEAKAIPYSEFVSKLETEGSFENYLETLMAEPLGTNGWASYTPSYTDEGAPYIKITGCEPNTTYAILVRPYRNVNGETKLGYANFIVAATAPIPGDIDFKPTPPVVLTDEGTWTDTSATIKWKNVNALKYEVVYSNVFYNDIETQYEGGIQISLDAVDNDAYRYLDIEGLFPDTEYFFWVRAVSPTNKSYWSNPAYVKTKTIRTPNPPSAFGIVSANDLALINEADGTKYTPKNKNYLIMQWLKDELGTVTTGTGESTEVADILSEPSLTGNYIAKFNNLISNKDYYFRAKTIITITMNEDRTTATEYSYVVQISLEPDFIEMQQIYVPNEPTLSEPYRQAESVWTPTLYFKTSPSGDDYDTDFDPDLVPLPDEDFEISFDGMTQTLTYRFRSSGKDAKGNYDNRVDQRFITNLVNRRVHNYNIDVTKYETYTIKRRVVEVPYTLLKTFEERKINFGVRAGDVTLTLPPAIMETVQVKNIPGYGDNAKLQIIFDDSTGVLPSLGMKDSYAMTPQSVSLFLQTPTQYIKMEKTGAQLGVKLKVDSRYDLLDKNLGAYVNNEQTSGWAYVKSTYDKENGQMEFNSYPGAFAIISKGSPDTVTFDQSTISMLNVASSITPTDIVVFNGNAPATSNQMLNIMDAIVNGKREAAINAVPDAAVVSSLQKAGMNIGPDAPSVLREQAIAAMVRLYELKAKRQIKSTYTVANTPYTDTSKAHQTYQPAMLKAAEIDILNGQSALRPKDILTLGELFELADVIISDTGM